jgi:hypothetical protein
MIGSLNLTTVRVRLGANYLPHLHTREIEMYEGPAMQLVDAGLAVIVEAEPEKRKRGRPKLDSHN